MGNVRSCASIAALICLVSLLGTTGCSRHDGPVVLNIDAGRYDEAFDAAIAAARDAGLTAEFLDRRGGIIETEPHVASSLLEPWAGDKASLGQAVEHTMGVHRRIARFEFEPVAFARMQADDAVLTGPAVVTGDLDAVDRTAYTGPIEIRIWVFLEELSRTGQRPSTWSRQMTSQFTQPATEGDDAPLPRQWWTSTSRDPDFERRLLAAVAQRLQSPGDS
ncbi:MAG: hypothetical protein KC983_04620 [Phycisphaerales bacterium]|nr:hypothetical protein [Phycisphaerales bacterium]